MDEPKEPISPGSHPGQADNVPPAPPTPRIAIDPAITFELRTVGGQTHVIASDAQAGKYFRMGQDEYRIALLLDGTRGVDEIVEVLGQEGIQWSAEDIAELLSRFVTNKVACPVAAGPTNDAGEPGNKAGNQTGHPPANQNAGPPSNPPPQPPPTPKLRQRLPRLLSMTISQRIPLIACNGIAKRTAAAVGFIFSGTGIILWLGLVLSGMTVAATHRQSLFGELSKLFDPGMWMIMLAVWIIAKVLHELGHAASASYHGVHVGKAGIMFFLFAPLAYVDVTDAWKLHSRWKRMQIAFSGVYVELAIASIAAWGWVWFRDGSDGLLSHVLAQIFFITGPATLLVNANPLLRLDGYYILSDLLEIPNLRMHGRKQLGDKINQWLVKIPAQTPLLSGWRRPAATFHALSSVLFQIVWMGGLIAGVAIWFQGLGVVLAIFALILWVAIPVTGWIAKVWKYDAESYRFLSPHRSRLIVAMVMVLATAGYLATANSPFARRVPVVVRFCEEQIARAQANAFVDQVFVHRGQRVDRGTLLVQLRAPELRLRRDELADDCRLSRMREVQLRHVGELAKAAAESERTESLKRQLAELDAEVESLRIVATRSGLVTGAEIENLEGSYVEEGQQLLCVCDPQEKELLVAVTTPNVEAYNVAVAKQQATSIRLRGGKSLMARLPPLRPRASQSLPHPALGANVGGPIPVQPSGDDAEMQSAVPLMQSVALLDPLTSVEVQAGQIGMMRISDNRSLLDRVIESVWK